MWSLFSIFQFSYRPLPACVITLFEIYERKFQDVTNEALSRILIQN